MLYFAPDSTNVTKKKKRRRSVLYFPIQRSCQTLEVENFDSNIIGIEKY